MEKTSDDVMTRPPRSKKRGFFTFEVLADLFTYGFLAGGLALGSFVFTIYVWGEGQLGENCNILCTSPQASGICVNN